MANVFLGSVGTAFAYVKNGGKEELFFTATTLTDSSINTGVTADEVRGGTGAKLLANFFHDTSFGLSMTDSMFNLAYIGAQVGEITTRQGGHDLYSESNVTSTGAAITLAKSAVGLLSNDNPVCLYRPVGSVEWESIEVNAQNQITLPAGEYCLRYWINNQDAKRILVKADFVPAELTVLLTTNLYAGDASAVETGKPVGKIVVRIPRFQLNGTFDLAMAMSSPAEVAIEGSALAYDIDCENSIYAEIIEIITGEKWYDDYEFLAADPEYLKTGDVPHIYAVGTKKTPYLVDNTELTFNPTLSGDGKFEQAQVTAFSVTDHVALSGSATVVNG